MTQEEYNSFKNAAAASMGRVFVEKETISDTDFFIYWLLKTQEGHYPLNAEAKVNLLDSLYKFLRKSILDNG